MAVVPFSIGDLQNPQGIERTLRLFDAVLQELSRPVPPAPLDINALAKLIRSQLQATGSAPLNIQNLLGSTSAGFIEGTHATRLTSPASGYPPGTAFYETDRGVVYAVVDSAGQFWKYVAGTQVASISNLPADLGVDDAGYDFYANDAAQLTEYIWTGAAWVTIGGFLQIIATVANNTVVPSLNLVDLTTARLGTLAGFGTGVRVDLERSDGNQAIAGAWNVAWTVPTAGGETSSWSVQLRNAGAAIADFFKVLVSGIRFKIGGFFAILIHANSADRTYTLANESGNLAYATVALTANEIALGDGGAKVKPLGAAGTATTILHGGSPPTFSAVDLAADVTGALPIANGGTDAVDATTARGNLGAAESGGVGAYTIALAPLTGGGTPGAISWNADGCVTSFTDPT